MKLQACLYTTRYKERQLALTASFLIPALVFFFKPEAAPVDLAYILGEMLCITYVFEIGFGFYDELRDDLAGPHGVMNLGTLVTSLLTGIVTALMFGIGKGVETAVVAGFGFAIAVYSMMRLLIPLEFGTN